MVRHSLLMNVEFRSEPDVRRHWSFCIAIFVNSVCNPSPLVVPFPRFSRTVGVEHHSSHLRLSLQKVRRCEFQSAIDMLLLLNFIKCYSIALVIPLKERQPVKAITTARYFLRKLYTSFQSFCSLMLASRSQLEVRSAM